MSNGVGDQVRQILIDFKHSKYGLGEAKRKMMKLIWDTNQQFKYVGKMEKATEWRMTERCAGCGILLKSLAPNEKFSLGGVDYCDKCCSRIKNLIKE